ncbi:OprD family outer membrane porin [Pseudomonas sp. RW3S2]|uniref:OprD family outer membrane porin n=1 Tax=Pseudomonas sp. RW3S2 TaxID=485884 RepID=UPI002353D3A8|nr:OprD family outer membrane porin [Pseudomonas sp. RW3S2]
MCVVRYFFVSAAAVMVAQTNATDFIQDSKAVVSSRTLYFNNNNRETDAQDQRQTAQGFKVDFSSGYTSGIVGFGLDIQAIAGFNIDGGIDHPTQATSNSMTPVDSDGTPVSSWSRGGGNLKAKVSESELVVGNALSSTLPILVINDGRLFPQTFGGAMLTVKEIPGLTLAAGKLTQTASRASSNYSGLAVAGGAKGSNDLQYRGGDWRPRNDLLLQYYHATLKDYYDQDFLWLSKNF